MAIGDSFALLQGTASTERQPSSGVVEQLCAIITSGTADAVGYKNSSTECLLVAATVITGAILDDALNTPGQNTYNCSVLIDNTTWYHKQGTINIHGISGVQVDA